MKAETKVEIIERGSWAAVLNAARATQGRPTASANPARVWIRGILLAEHSPIRVWVARWRWIDLPYWVSVHFVRHKVGIEHFVQSQREDRTGEPRNEKRQDSPVIHECAANAQAILAISRKRLCNLASQETRDAWSAFLRALDAAGERELVSCCVPECVYRGWCPEMHPCGFAETAEFLEALQGYRNIGGVYGVS